MSRRRLAGVLLLLFAVYRAQVGGGLISSPAPFKTDILRMLIIENTEDRESYTPDQRAAILGTAEGSLIATVKARGGEYRILDKDQTDLSASPPWVAEAFAVPHEAIPWIVTAGPKSGTSEALPPKMPEILGALEAAK